MVTWLAYKGSGYADTGPLQGIDISDVVSLWSPYNLPEEERRNNLKTRRSNLGIVGRKDGVAGKKAEGSGKSEVEKGLKKDVGVGSGLGQGVREEVLKRDAR